MVKVKVLHGFTDANNNNYQDNEITELSDERFEKLKGLFVEPFSEPVVEVNSKDLLEKNEELEKIVKKSEKTKEQTSEEAKNPEQDKDKEDAKVQK